MTATKKAAPVEGAAGKVLEVLEEGRAAVAEIEELKPKTVEWRGLTFELPPELPGVMLFDLAELEQDDDRVGPLINLLGSLIGGDGVARVKTLVRDEAMSFEATGEALNELIEAVTREYGTAPGNSSGSPTSSRSGGGPAKPTSNGSTAST